MPIEDRPNDFDVQLLVVVNGNIPEPDHGLHARRSIGIDFSLILPGARMQACYGLFLCNGRSPGVPVVPC